MEISVVEQYQWKKGCFLFRHINPLRFNNLNIPIIELVNRELILIVDCHT